MIHVYRKLEWTKVRDTVTTGIMKSLLNIGITSCNTHLFTPTLGPTQPPTQWVPGIDNLYRCTVRHGIPKLFIHQQLHILLNLEKFNFKLEYT